MLPRIAQLLNTGLSGKIALAMSGAKEESAQEAPELHQRVERLSVRAHLDFQHCRNGGRRSDNGSNVQTRY